jgi:hypothetical protein
LSRRIVKINVGITCIVRKKRNQTETFRVCLGHTPENEPVDLDVFSLIASRALVCCNSGGGKSYLLRKLVELVASKVPTLVIDPEGEFSTLRELVDLVLVGPDGEVPASTATAAKLAKRLMELRVNAVIDLSAMGLEDKQLFVKLFLDSLLSLPRDLWSHTFVVIDEAHKFAPTEQANVVSTASVVALMDQGRKRRLGGVLATQRLSKLVASARAEANNVFIGKTAQDLDLRRAVDLLGLEKKDWQTIKRARPGDFWAFGPALVVQDGVTHFRVGRVQTTHEDEGRDARGHAPEPSTAILRVVPELSDLQQEVEAEKDELAKLREEIVELRSRTSSRGASHADLEKARAEAAAAGYEVGWARCRARVHEVVHAQWALFSSSIEENLKATSQTPQASPAKPHLPVTVSAPAMAPSPVVRSKKTTALEDVSGSDDGGLGRGAAFKIVTVLVRHNAAMPRARAAFLAGIKPTTGTFRNALSTLRLEHLLIDHANGDVEATDAARARFRNLPPLPSGRELIDFWRHKFGDGATGKLFSVLVSCGALSRVDAAAEAGITSTSGTFRNAMSTLRVAGVLHDLGGGRVELAPHLRSLVTSSTQAPPQSRPQGTRTADRR